MRVGSRLLPSTSAFEDVSQAKVKSYWFHQGQEEPLVLGLLDMTLLKRGERSSGSLLQPRGNYEHTFEQMANKRESK